MESEAANDLGIGAEILGTGESEPAPDTAVRATRGREADALLVLVGIIGECNEGNARYPLLRTCRLELGPNDRRSGWTRGASICITGTADERQGAAKDGEGGWLIMTVHGDLLAAPA